MPTTDEFMNCGVFAGKGSDSRPARERPGAADPTAHRPGTSAAPGTGPLTLTYNAGLRAQAAAARKDYRQQAAHRDRLAEIRAAAIWAGGALALALILGLPAAWAIDRMLVDWRYPPDTFVLPDAGPLPAPSSYAQGAAE